MLDELAELEVLELPRPLRLEPRILQPAQGLFRGSPRLVGALPGLLLLCQPSHQLVAVRPRGHAVVAKGHGPGEGPARNAYSHPSLDDLRKVFEFHSLPYRLKVVSRNLGESGRTEQ